MFLVRAEWNRLRVLKRVMITSGARELFRCRFELGEGCEDMNVTAVFQAGRVARETLLDEENSCLIPWEVLEKPGIQLMAGLIGTKNGRRLPTIWVELGMIFPGAIGGASATPPPTDVYAQILEKANEAAQDAAAVRKDAAEGRFNGPPGPAGHSPVKGEDYYTEADKQEIIQDVLKHPVSEEQIQDAVNAYLKENPPEAGAGFEVDRTLSLKDGILSVNTADVVEKDNTLPVTSAAVEVIVGNIGAILDTI